MFTGDTQSLGSFTARYALDIITSHPHHTHTLTTSHTLLLYTNLSLQLQQCVPEVNTFNFPPKKALGSKV